MFRFSAVPLFRCSALLACLLLFALSACTMHPQDPGGGPVVVGGSTTQEAAARVRLVAESIARAYPDKPEVARVAAGITAAADLIGSGEYQSAGRALVSLAALYPAYREYAVMASIALELLSPGPATSAKDATATTWSACVRAAAPGP